MPSAPTPTRRSLVEAVVAATVGTTIEWYDFFLYGTAAALVFPRLYFPKADPFTGQILAFSTFTVGFIARPIGGVVFGYMGDRIGRKSALVTTLLLMGFSTLAIGFLPTYAEWGVAAPILLAVLRFVQGLGVGGEWGGAVLMALEYGHRGRRGFYASWPQAGVPLGLLASTGVMYWCKASMSAADFDDWGWRIPFYLSGALIVVGLLIRLRILETPLFAELQRENRLAEAPVRETLANHWREILLVAGTRVAENASFYLFAIWVIGYGRDELHVAEEIMLTAVSVAAAVEFFTIPLFGVVSDRFLRRRTYMFGCCFLFVFALPYYMLLDTGQTECIVLAIVLALGIGHAVLYSVQAALIPELFGTRVRCTGASIAYQIATPLAGGTAPLIAASLNEAFRGEHWLPAVLAAHIMVMAVLSFLCVHRLAETANRELGDPG